jgi:hypothetical protein
MSAPKEEGGPEKGLWAAEKDAVEFGGGKGGGLSEPEFPPEALEIDEGGLAIDIFRRS